MDLVWGGVMARRQATFASTVATWLLRLLLLLSISVTHPGSRCCASACSFDSCHDKPLYQCSLEACSSSATSVVLAAQNVSGTIPASIFQLSDLTELSLSGNALTGTLPDRFSRLSFLRTLDVEGNSLTGTVPGSLGSLSYLKSANLARNSLHGTVPAFWGQLLFLTSLNLAQNLLSGYLPDSLCALEGRASVVLNDASCVNEYAVNYETLAAVKLYGELNWEGACMWYFFMQDVACGTPFQYLGARYTKTATHSVPPTSYSCPNTEYYQYWGTGNGVLSAGPYAHVVHFRDFTQCNLHGQLSDQAFWCPLPLSCADWLRQDCGAWSCSAEGAMASSERRLASGSSVLNDTANLARNVSEAAEVEAQNLEAADSRARGLAAGAAASLNSIEALERRLGTQMNLVAELNRSVASQVEKIDALRKADADLARVEADLEQNLTTLRARQRALFQKEALGALLPN